MPTIGILRYPAACRLDIDEAKDTSGEMPASPMPPAAQVTQTGGADDGDRMDWVRRQREASVSWAEIAQAASLKGYQGGEDAPQSRIARWCEKQAEAGFDFPTA